MNLQFTKMHGLGNDFIVIDAIRQRVDLTPQQIAALSPRDTGIGFDQCLFIERSHEPSIDFFYRIFNADGQEVGQCGNGARCLARYVHHYGLTQKTSISVATRTTRMQLMLHENGEVTVDMGRPQLTPIAIPIDMPAEAKWYTIPIDEAQTCQVHAISVGNPHAVMVVNDLHQTDVQELGRCISHHPLFPEQTNVGFMQIKNPRHIDLRVFERGSGETRACGSGAVAAVALGRLYHQLEPTVTVSLPGGDLSVHWPSLTGSIFLRGPATFVYEGALMCALSF